MPRVSPAPTPAPGARETLAQVLARCDAQIARDPTDYVAWHDRGSALFEAGQLAEALACYEPADRGRRPRRRYTGVPANALPL